MSEKRTTEARHHGVKPSDVTATGGLRTADATASPAGEFLVRRFEEAVDGPRAEKARIYEITCPYCKAKPGEKCVDFLAREVANGHQARWVASVRDSPVHPDAANIFVDGEGKAERVDPVLLAAGSRSETARSVDLNTFMTRFVIPHFEGKCDGITKQDCIDTIREDLDRCFYRGAGRPTATTDENELQTLRRELQRLHWLRDTVGVDIERMFARAQKEKDGREQRRESGTAAVVAHAYAADRAELDRLRKAISRLGQWTYEFGHALRPSGADTYGEGVRACKAQVAGIIAASDCASEGKEENDGTRGTVGDASANAPADEALRGGGARGGGALGGREVRGGRPEAGGDADREVPGGRAEPAPDQATRVTADSSSPAPEQEDCGSCRGYGHFSKKGKPSIDRRDRKCLDCAGTGKAAT